MIRRKRFGVKESNFALSKQIRREWFGGRLSMETRHLPLSPTQLSTKRLKRISQPVITSVRRLVVQQRKHPQL